MSIQRFKFQKVASEKLILPFDFANGLATGEILTGPISVSVQTARGKDATPNAMLNGAAIIDATSKIVFQAVQGGVVGAEYLIEVIAPTSNPKKVLAIKAVLPVI